MIKPWNDDRLASNGRAVRENFTDWFGDSKVVNADGTPLVVYHGYAGQKFDAFDAKHLGKHNDNVVSRLGFFFTPDKEIAQDYAYQASWNIAPDDEEHTGDDQCISSVYLTLQNPIEIDATKMDGYDDGANVLSDLVNRAKKDGYDGAIIKNWADGSGTDIQYVAFDATQIKSATDNKGLYLKNNASLTDQDADISLLYARQARIAVEEIVKTIVPKAVPC